MICDICTELLQPRNGDTRILFEDETFCLIPTVGGFVEGYVLLIPIDHERSYAYLTPEDIRKGITLAELARNTITSIYGPTLIAEHGIGDARDYHVACCDHAHLHIIPIPDVQSVLVEYQKVGGMPSQILDPAELAQYRGSPYLLFSPQRGAYYIWTEVEAFPQQFVRRLCSAQYGLGDQFDWGLYPFPDILKRTTDRLRSQFSRLLESTRGPNEGR